MNRRLFLGGAAVIIAALSWSCSGDSTGGTETCKGADCAQNTADVSEVECRTGEDCGIGKECKDNECVEPSTCPQKPCPGDQRCVDGGCYPPPSDTSDTGTPDTADVGDGKDAADGGDAEQRDVSCNGCFATEKKQNCLPGVKDKACGLGGKVCRECEGDKVCSQGECQKPPSCNPSNCNGCCEGTVCRSGADPQACGSDGEQCQQCLHGATCEDGDCTVPCNSDTCPEGCCTDDGKCVEGMADDACGKNGGECIDCSDEQFCSQDQTCVEKSCKDRCDGCCSGDTCLAGDTPSACGTGGDLCRDCSSTNRGCSQQGCVVRSDSRWDVQAYSVQIPDKNGNGEAWDPFGGLPDPYVQIKAFEGNETFTGESESRQDVFFPIWKEVVLSDMKGSNLVAPAPIELYLYDYDRLDPDDHISECIVHFEDAVFNGTVFKVRCDAAESSEPEAVTTDIRLKLIPR